MPQSDDASYKRTNSVQPTPLCEAKVRVRLPSALLQLDMGFSSGDVSRPLPLQFHKSAVDAQAVVEPWSPDNCRSALKHSQEYLAGGNLLWLSLTRHPCDNVVIDELSYKDIEQLARLMNLRPGSIELARLRKHFCLARARLAHLKQPRTQSHCFPVKVEVYTWELLSGFLEVLHFLSDMKPVAVWWVPCHC